MEQMFFPVTQKKASQTGVERSSAANKNAIFPTQLRDLRREKGVSQDELSKILGVSKSTLGLWETGDTLPDARSLHDLAVYYGVSADYLLGLSDVRTANTDVRAICEYTGLCNESIASVLKAKNRGLIFGCNAFLSSSECIDVFLLLQHLQLVSDNLRKSLDQYYLPIHTALNARNTDAVEDYATQFLHNSESDYSEFKYLLFELSETICRIADTAFQYTELKNKTGTLIETCYDTIS